MTFGRTRPYSNKLISYIKASTTFHFQAIANNKSSEKKNIYFASR